LKKIYGFPDLPKAGLANMLIPWADCFLWCKDRGIRRIAPFWFKARLGPFIRRERDKRQYQRLFKKGSDIGGIKRLLLILTSRKISAESYRLSGDPGEKSRATVVCFSDMNRLDRLVGRHKEVVDELYRITRPRYRPIGLPAAYIGIHIRMGDFPQKQGSNGSVNFRQPLEWYVEALKRLRASLGIEMEAVVFSDGSDEELAPILGLNHVFRSPFSESISDLLALAKSSVIITSRSSFSLLGAYLGQVPSIWYTGKREVYRSSYMPGGQEGLLEIEWMPGQRPPDRFVEVLKARIRSEQPC
jgi:hypothetical protein